MSYIRDRGVSFISLAELLFRRPAALQTIVKVKQEKLTLLGPGALADIALAVREVEWKQIPGALIEAGCALGGSAILMAKTKIPSRPLRIYDVFERIPSPGSQDGEDAHERFSVIQGGQAKGIGGDTYYGYVDDLYEKVRASFKHSGCPVELNQVSMIKGLIEDTLQVDEPVALAHIDCDWYSPVMACLQRIVPHLSPGGRLIIDDYFAWSGARKAVDEYFSENRAPFTFLRRQRLHIIKK